MEGLFQSQILLSEELKRLRSNFKKDPKTRKTPVYLRRLLANVESLSNDYTSTHKQILGMLTGDDAVLLKPYFTEYQHSSFREMLIDFESDLEELLENVESDSKVPHSDVQAKLPRIELPQFSGDYNSWTAFKDLFNSLIVSKDSISKEEKLHYLKCSLRGEPANLLNSFKITEQNFDLAWKTLKERYDNKAALMNTQFKKLVANESVSESATSIKGLLDTTMESVQILEGMHALNLWHSLVVFLAVQRLSVPTRTLWEQEQATKKDALQLEDLRMFLNTRFRTLEATGSKAFGTPVRRLQAHYVDTSIECSACKQNHKLTKCPKFVNSNQSQRYDIAKRNRLCLNCLAKGHMAVKCPSSTKCFKCRGSHHTMLHKDSNSSAGSWNQSSSFPSTSASPFVPATVNSLTSVASKNVLLATAIVSIVGRSGIVKLRALLDQGSQASFMTEEAVQRCGLQRRTCDAFVSGIGTSNSMRSKGFVGTNIKTLDAEEIWFEAYVLSRLTNSLPTQYLEVPQHTELDGVQLADPKYNIPGRVDLILGAVYVYGKLLLTKSKLLFDGLLLQQTKLGWVLSGFTNRARDPHIQSFKIELSIEHHELNEQLKRFWELEEPMFEMPAKPEDKRCEDLYQSSTSRNEAGRFVVRLPFKDESSKDKLGSSRRSAELSLLSLERRFDRDPPLRLEYTNCIRDHIRRGHLSPVNRIEEISTIHGETRCQAHYLPHHAVRKDSSTTKTRIVFDASRKTSSGFSLNDTLLTGPIIQNDMLSVLLRWRLQKFAFVADIEKMYLQILIHDDDRDYQRILWRFDRREPIVEYRFNTVIFGVTSAPFLAIRTFEQLAQENEHRCPRAAAMIRDDFYVDDVLSGANTQGEAKNKISELNQVLKSAGFHLRKWVANDPTILDDIETEDIENVCATDLGMDHGHKSLGIIWHPSVDVLAYKYSVSANSNCFTKRAVLSDIAKVYDPLGWISPVLVRAKCWMQQMWLRGLDWDDQLPDEMRQYWVNLRNDFKAVETIKIPRWIMAENVEEIEVHGFCDASQAAYGVAIYFVTKGPDGAESHLMMSKTKVAPIKPVTIPRLELCGAVLLSKVMRYLLSTINNGVKITQGFLWTDSKIVLAWIRGHPSKWTVFVSNRTCQILENVPNVPWRYVPSKCNPADIASRGSELEQQVNNSLWWNGPSWLLATKEQWPGNEEIDPTDLELRAKPAISCHIATTKEGLLDKIIQKFSKLSRLIRVLAYCLRFCHAIRNRCAERGSLTRQECDESMRRVIAHVRHEEFGKEISSLRSNKPLERDSKLKGLNPFLDGDGLVRIGGRLAYANMSFDEKFPIILPKNGNLTKLVVEDVHQTTLHGDIQLMLATIRKQFWILDARNIVKRCTHECIKCFRTKAQTATQLMGSLPAPRVTISRPFTHVGVDYCGPISLKDRKGRGGRIYKGYIAIFVCLAVKAMHIEVVNDLTTDAFLAAFRRFVSRRGLCTDVYSDLGTNFVGASAEMMRIAKSNCRMAEYAENKRINWHFNPPASPHFGGLWEAGVKSMKLHLRRTLGNAILTFEELCTTTCQIEACLNSRPLCQIHDDSSEASALTPAHFLIGDTLLSLPETNLLDVRENYLTRWQLTQRLAQMFWQRWSKEHLARLQQRPKWVSREMEPRIGDVCLLKDERLPSHKWPLAKIIELHPGKDNVVRVVSVTRDHKHFKRNITKIALLPIAN